MTIRISILAALAAALLSGQVTFERIVNAEKEPGNWLTYSRTYRSNHYSPLDQIKKTNVGELELKWVFQADGTTKFQSSPLVVDGVLYVTHSPNNIAAIDAATGRVFWRYEHAVPAGISVCCGQVNRGLAILGDSLFMATIDGRLMAFDAKTGSVRWDVKIVDNKDGYALTVAPLVVKDKVVIGTAGGEYGIRGFVDAYDAETGKRAWRFWTIPGPGEPGHETWTDDAWERGGGSIWVTGSYDPELDLMYWGTGNPSPDWNADVRPGDNLYTDSAIALDPDTGELKWHFQFTPHDWWDWDAVQIPVLADIEFEGRQRKVLLWGNRNAFFYVLDRVTGEFLLGKPFAYQNWAAGLDESGRPIVRPGTQPSREGTKVYPSVQGATNWYAPTYHPRTKLYYLAVWDRYPSTYHKGDATYVRGARYPGSFPRGIYPDSVEDEETGFGAIRALDPRTGERKWEFKMTGVSESGLISTAGDVIFSGSMEGHFLAVDVDEGKLLWRTNLGGRMANSPITYLAKGKQLVSVASGHSLFTFGLRE
ncbi:MAG TPA: PQQ-dependent dehydrogenase, methanol/ethanol family [Bryobacterales bacterium]|nr:PQQ-dependent dehydrogenase, methanol/ethanol family [Bryobacterales bacterium]